MPFPSFLAPLFLGGASILGGALAGRGQRVEQRPEIPPEFRQLFGPLSEAAISGLQQPLGAGFEARGIQDINRVAGLGQQSLENVLGRQGLLRSPVAGAVLGQQEIGRQSDIARFLTSIPLLEQQFGQQGFAQALNLLRSIPTGQVQLGQAPGGVLGGAFGGLGGSLGLLAGLGALPGIPGLGQSGRS